MSLLIWKQLILNILLPSSPTQRVGMKVEGSFEKVVHGRPMLSLSNVFSADEVRAFASRVEGIRS